MIISSGILPPLALVFAYVKTVREIRGFIPQLLIPISYTFRRLKGFHHDLLGALWL